MLGADATTLVAFESPRRLAATLDLLAQQCPGRPVAVCRELTKLHEEVRRGSAVELAAHYRQQPPRGEVALVVGPAEGVGRDPRFARMRWRRCASWSQWVRERVRRQGWWRD